MTNEEMNKMLQEMLEDYRTGAALEETTAKKDGKKRILAVDDMLEFLNQVASILGKGYLMSLAKNVHQAAKILSKKKIDLVILDQGMADLSGLDFLRMIRTIPALSKVPVIFLTANATQDLIKDTAPYGVAGFLVKPVKPDVLLKTVASIVGPPQGLSV